jgi:hypothetical protein
MAILDNLSKPGSVTYLKGVLFGPPKTGKTTTACNTAGKVLLVMMEPEGDLAVAGRENVDVVRPENWQHLNEILRSLYTTHKGRWDTVVFDSITFMFELIAGKDLAEVFRQDKDPRRTYLKGGTAINQLLRDAVYLPMNVIFICQMKVDTPDEGATTPLNPEDGDYPLTLAVTPMVYKVLAPAVSFLGRTYKKTGLTPKGVGTRTRQAEYWVSFEDFGKSPAGSRISVPDQVQSLNLDDLLATAKGATT